VFDPYADFTYFGLLLYVVLPTLLLGCFGLANRRWTLFVVVLAATVHFSTKLTLPGGLVLREFWIAAGYALFEGAVAFAFLRWRSRPSFYLALAATILPLVAAKLLPVLAPQTQFGFLGISYVTFRALDVIFSIHDGVLKTLSPTTWLGFVFFFPTISSGPVDRYRRFEKDWLKRRSRPEFLDDFDFAVARVFRGFLYKFIIAALISTYWSGPLEKQSGPLATWGYMYAFTFYLFFDFAGYSAFAVGISRLFGIRAPENFDRPFLSRNIREFWNRWHISLSFWFRDHIYMRFLLAAAKGKWFSGKHTASWLGMFLTFGIMGVWHGFGWHFILYGLYHAALLVGYDLFARWNKAKKHWGEGRVQHATDILLTFHAIAFGMLLFSGRLGH